MKAAVLYIEQFYPNCQGAILAGSVIRGEATATSDLDIVIFDKTLKSSYRESIIKYDWPIELFIHNLQYYKQFFHSDCERARPTLPRMVAEGIVLKDEGIMEEIKREAEALLGKGPAQWSYTTIELKRYFLTDVLEDFIGCKNRNEGIFIANELATLTSEFKLRTNGQWVGHSKWLIRSLKEFDEQFAQQFVHAFDSYYSNNKKDEVVRLVDEVLSPYGGRLFRGFSIGK